MATTITTGQLNAHFGVNMTGDFVRDTLGFTPAEIGRAGHPRWLVSDVPAIGTALSEHVLERASWKVAPAPKKPRAPAAKPPVEDDDDL